MKKNIKKAPLYLVVTRLNSLKQVSTRVFSLSRAVKKDNCWVYPSDAGNKHVPFKNLNVIDNSEFKKNTVLRVYSLVSNLNKNIRSVTSVYKTSASATVKKEAPAPVAQTPVTKTPAAKTSATKTPVIEIPPVVATKRFQEKDMKDVNDVNAILAGKKNAFAGIYERHEARVNRYYMANLRFNKDLADDLTMEFFVKIYEKIHLYKPEYTFNSWITQAAKNHLIDYFRKLKQSPLIVEIDKDLTNDEGETTSLTLRDENALTGEEIIFNQEKKDALNTAMFNMDKKGREIIRLYFIDNKSYKEISDITKTPINSVKVNLLRAKAKLKDILEKNKVLLAAVA